MLVMVAFAIVSTMALGIGAGYIAILGILRMFGHQARVQKPAPLALKTAAVESSGD
jgi:hypothetical protein